MRYRCRGPRVLDAAAYCQVFRLVAAGRLQEAQKRLEREGVVVQLADTHDLAVLQLLHAADSRRGCGEDLTDLIAAAGPGAHNARCPRCGQDFSWEAV